jgi:hypothetical protein
MRWTRGYRHSHAVVVSLACAAAAAAGLMLAGCAGAQQAYDPSRPTPGLPVPASAIPRLTVIAEGVVRANGGVAPAWVSVVVTTHAKALTSATPGDTVPGDENTVVYLMTMKGHFADRLASTPSGAKAPAGRYLSSVLDARTFQGMDLGLSPGPPPVAPSSFGPVTYLKVIPPARDARR